MAKQPLNEVFGFPIDNQSTQAQRYRAKRLCPFNNKVANCTKDKANDPLGVCSIRDADKQPVITCPVRFRQEWIIADDAAQFFFPEDANWTTLTEVRINDANGKSAGNIDLVLVQYDDNGQLLDFGSLEIQAVYISGNVRRPFAAYMHDPSQHATFDWSAKRHYPRPDYLSSSRKRLVPQLIYKGGILKAWERKQAVALHRGFFETLPTLPPVSAQEADIAWLIYDLTLNDANIYELRLHDTIYTQFTPALNAITLPESGPIQDFIDILQTKLDQHLDDEQNPPDAPTLDDMLRG